MTTESGSPLAGAVVQLLPAVDPVEAARLELDGRFVPEPLAVSVADRQGRFRLDGISPGMWSVRAEAEGFVAMEHRLAPGLGSVKLPTVRLPRDVGLEARAVDQEGRPVAGARARLELFSAPDRGDGWYRPASFAVAGEDGSLRLARGQNEDVRLMAASPVHGETAAVRLHGPAPSPIELRFGAAQRFAAQVVDPRGLPLGDVVLRAGHGSWTAAITDEDGRAELWTPAPDGLAVEIADLAGSRERILLQPADGGVSTLVLPPADRLHGQIIDEETGRGIEGAVVWRLGEPESFVVSGPEGRYEISAAPDRALSIAATAEGYAVESVTLGESRVDRSEVSPLALRAGAEVAGRVVDPSGLGLAGVAVSVAVHRRDGAVAGSGGNAARTSEDGSFSLGALKSDQARWLRFEKKGFASVWRALPALRARTSHRLGTIVLPPGRTVFGWVMDEEDRPLAQAEVKLLRGSTSEETMAGADAGPREHEARTDESGRFEISSVPAGVFRLHARARGLFPLQVPGLDIPPGNEPHDIGRLLLASATALEGRVLGDGGQPIAGAVVETSYSFGDEPRESASSTTDHDGRFTVRGLPMSSVVDLRARAEGYADTRLRRLELPVKEPVRLVLEGAASISGRVLGSRGESIPGAVITALPETAADETAAETKETPPPRVATANEDGFFEVSGLRPGRWSLSAEAAGHVSSRTEPLELAAGDDAEAGDIVLPPGARIEGRVVSVDGEPLGGANLALRPHLVSDGKPLSRSVDATSDTSGHFRLEGVGAGPHSLVANRKGYLRQVEIVEVAAGSGAEWIELVLEPGNEIAGRVVDEEGRPLAAVRLRLASPPSEESPGSFRSGRFEGHTRANGSFLLQGLPQGTYQLVGEKEGYATASLDYVIELSSGPVTGLELRLSRGAGVSGRLEGLDFEELAQVEISAWSSDGLLVEGEVDFTSRYGILHLGPGSWRVAGFSPVSGKQALIDVEIDHSGIVQEYDLVFQPAPDELMGRSGIPDG